ncbi:MAG TPA: ATP-binding protein [Candidatus Angelobacter sp.]
MKETLPDPVAHTVQFYEQDRFFLESATRFLAAALGQGTPAILIATEEHRNGVAARLQALGIDVSGARDAERYIELDAEQVLSAVMREGKPDADRSRIAVRDVLARISRACGGKQQPVAVAGEAVSLLSARSEHEAALQLERIWNDMAREYCLTLFCGYVARNFDRAAHADVFWRICAEHTDVLPEEGYLELENSPDRRRYVARLQQQARALETEKEARQRSEEALVRSEKLAAVGRLTASIAHEINNPLTSLTNLFYLINMDTSLDATVRHYVALADQELRRTARITKQMLAFHRESSSRVPCKIAPIIDGVLELYEPRLRKSNIRLERHYKVEGAIEAFPAEMRQLFANLIGNAIEAVGDNGRIRLRVAGGRDWTNPSRLGVRIAIADSGPGISAEDRGRIFEPFFTTKGESGTGLGLWVSRGIVQKHEGRITFRSRLSQDHRGGTVFSIFLPATHTLEAEHRDNLDALGATG